MLTTLDDEWRETPAPPSRGSRFVGLWLVAAAATLLLVVSVVWGVGLRPPRRSRRGGSDQLLAVALDAGGTEFRVGALRGVGGEDVGACCSTTRSGAGPGRPSSKTSQSLRRALRHAHRAGRFSLPFERLWGEEGEADGWLVTEDDLRSVDRLTLRDADGNAIAAARISDA